MPKTIFNFFKDLLDDIVFGVKNIFEFLGGIIEAFLQLFKDIFIPSDGYFTNKFKSLSNLLKGKFESNVDAIETLKNSSSTESITNHTVTIMGTSVNFKFDFISKAKPVCNAIFLGLGGIFLAWYNYRKVYQLIRGTAPISGNNPNGGGSNDN